MVTVYYPTILTTLFPLPLYSLSLSNGINGAASGCGGGDQVWKNLIVVNNVM